MKIGDVVKIVDLGKIYTTYSSWAKANGGDKWINGFSPGKSNYEWKIINIAPHSDIDKEGNVGKGGAAKLYLEMEGLDIYKLPLFLIENLFGQQVIIEESGVELIRSADFLTSEEVEL